MALRDINLVPADVLFHQHLVRHISFWAGCLILSLSLVGSFYVYEKHVTLSKKRPFESLKDTNTQLGATLEEIKRVQGELERLHTEQSALERIAGSQSYAKILVKLAEVMNESTWLTEIALDQVKGEERLFSLKISGFSLSNEEVGNFLNKLSKEQMFRSTALKYARETKIGQWSRDADPSIKLIKFQLECNVSRG
jgi:Tfp pilus assembly protein PilN